MANQIRVKITETYERVFLDRDLAEELGEPPTPAELLVEQVEALLKDGHNEGATRVLNAVIAEENASGYEFTVEEF